MHLTDADQASYDAVSQMLKAATAYVPPEIGRMLAVFAKSIELQHMMAYLDSGNVSACGTGGRPLPPEDILKDLRKYCGPREKEQLDKCLNLLNMAKMYELYKNLAGSADMVSAASAMTGGAFGPTANQRSAAGSNASQASGTAHDTAAPGMDNNYLKHMQSLLTPEQLQLLNNISSQQHPPYEGRSGPPQGAG